MLLGLSTTVEMRSLATGQAVSFVSLSLNRLMVEYMSEELGRAVCTCWGRGGGVTTRHNCYSTAYLGDEPAVMQDAL